MKLKHLLLALLLALLTGAWEPEEGGDMPDPPAPPVVTWGERWAAEGVEVTADLTVGRCLHYLPLVRGWNRYFDLPEDVVLALMAAESACDEGMKDGLMQVVPRPWLFSEGELRNSSTNVYAGMYLLYSAWDNPTRNPARSMRLALAAYNCGWEKLEAGRCVEYGGLAYADQVLGFWLPRFRAACSGCSTLVAAGEG